jgi:hypothetical protein
MLSFYSILTNVCMYGNWCEGIRDTTAFPQAGKGTAVVEKRSIRSTLLSGFLYLWMPCTRKMNVSSFMFTTFYNMWTQFNMLKTVMLQNRGLSKKLIKMRQLHKRVLLKTIMWRLSYVTEGSFHIKSTQKRNISNLTHSKLNDFLWNYSTDAQNYPDICMAVWPLDLESRHWELSKEIIFGISCIRKRSISSVLIETQSSFYAHFKANKMTFPIILFTNILQNYVFKVLRSDFRPCISQGVAFQLL